MIKFKDVISAVGQRVLTKLNERGAVGMLIKPEYLANRENDIQGTVRGYVPGHGGDVWWVEHDGTKKVAAYCTDEMFDLVESGTSPN